MRDGEDFFHLAFKLLHPYLTDAFVIADYMRFGRLPMSVVKEEQYVALQQLTRARYQITRQIIQKKQRFLQYLSYKCNTFTEDVDSSVFGKAMMDLFLYYLVEATNSVRRQIPEYRDYYAKKYQEVPKHQHKRALVLTARKFVRLVDALLRKTKFTRPKGASYMKHK